jgi:hypothetical protein
MSTFLNRRSLLSQSSFKASDRLSRKGVPYSIQGGGRNSRKGVCQQSRLGGRSFLKAVSKQATASLRKWFHILSKEAAATLGKVCVSTILNRRSLLSQNSFKASDRLSKKVVPYSIQGGGRNSRKGVCQQS